MKKILWLDDEPVSISYEKDVLIPDNFDDNLFEIKAFDMIDELLEYISKNKINKDDIFIIDIMLVGEERIITPKKDIIEIKNDLMAGATLYSDFFKENFPNNVFILYTSRENEEVIFQNIMHEPKFGKTLFMIEKSQKDTELLKILGKFLQKVKND